MVYRILIADDDPMLRGLLRHKLHARGFEVETVENGAEALAAVDRQRPDIVILDGMMPVMSGDEALGRLVERPDFDQFHVLMLSARRDGDDVVKALRSGADDYITKPFNPEELAERLLRLLGPDEQLVNSR